MNLWELMLPKKKKKKTVQNKNASQYFCLPLIEGNLSPQSMS